MFVSQPLRRVLCALTVLSFASAASAHFVWIESKPVAGGIQVRSGFGEAGGWDPDLVDRMSDTKFWTRTGQALAPLSIVFNDDEREYRTNFNTDNAPDAIMAASDFGVVQLGSKPASWLRYSAKHLVGAPSTWNDDTVSTDVRIEVLAKFDNGEVTLRVVHLGKPLADATIKLDAPKGEQVELKTDAQGTAKFAATGAGNYALYVGTTTPGEGETKGKKYTALMDYATLTFTLP